MSTESSTNVEICRKTTSNIRNHGHSKWGIYKKKIFFSEFGCQDVESMKKSLLKLDSKKRTIHSGAV